MLAAFVLDATTRAAVLDAPSTFSQSTENWTGDEPTLVPNGGPAGDGDGFLLAEATGGNGPGSRLAVYTDQPAFTGNLAEIGASSLRLDIKNFESTGIDLAIRLALFGPNSLQNRWTSAEPVMVPSDGNWHTITFPISPEAIERVGGSASYDQMLQNVRRLMLRHDTAPASGTGTTVSATVGFDNIVLLGASGPAGDFNQDGSVDVQDIDLLLQAVAAQSSDDSFDLTGDGSIDQQDILALVTDPSGLNSYVGDANLDGEFSSSDLVQVFQTAEYEDDVPMNSTWGTGDWNGDGEFGTGDLLFAFQQGGFEQGPRSGVMAQSVPEPSAMATVWIAAMFSATVLRRRFCYRR